MTPLFMKKEDDEELPGGDTNKRAPHQYSVPPDSEVLSFGSMAEGPTFPTPQELWKTMQYQEGPYLKQMPSVPLPPPPPPPPPHSEVPLPFTLLVETPSAQLLQDRQLVLAERLAQLKAVTEATMAEMQAVTEATSGEQLFKFQQAGCEESELTKQMAEMILAETNMAETSRRATAELMLGSATSESKLSRRFSAGDVLSF